MNMKEFLGCLALMTAAVSSAQEWSIEAVDSLASYPSIAIDSNDCPHIAYCSDNEILKYAMWNGSEWEFQIVDSTGSVGGAASLALDSQDNPHIAYYDGSDCSLKYTRWDGSSWVTTTIRDSGGWISLALDSSGNPHIAFCDYETEYPEVWYASWTGTHWLTSMVSYPGGFYPSIAVDSSDRPHLSYHQEYGYDLEYAYLNSNLEWEKTQVDTDGGTNTSIAVSSTDYPHISYTSSDGYLKTASWNGSSWETECVDDAVGWTSLVLNSSDNPRIAFFSTEDEMLSYASWNGSDWEIDAVDTIGEVSWRMQCTLALDSSQNPHMVYTDHNCNLKYAWKQGQETPDESGGFSSIEIQPNPFASELSITYSLAESADAEVSVFDILGRRQVNLVQGQLPHGENTIVWSPEYMIPAGIYFVVLESAGERVASRVVLIR